MTFKPWEDRGPCSIRILEGSDVGRALWVKNPHPAPKPHSFNMPGSQVKGMLPAIDKATGQVKTLLVPEDVLATMREWAEELRQIEERESETRKLMSFQQADHERFKAKRTRIRALASWWRHERDPIKNRAANRR